MTDSTDIVDGKLKLILGLIWTLILHYSISMPMWEGEDDLVDKDQTPKQRLLQWIQNKIPDRAIRNFTSDWNDGTNIGALVDACAPGQCPTLSVDSRIYNVGLADPGLNSQSLFQKSPFESVLETGNETPEFDTELGALFLLLTMDTDIFDLLEKLWRSLPHVV